MILYALRPFVATQKGQVSVDVNSKLTLLSDSHWYWWFVRNEKDDCEGFVPAAIVELPNERLARLNRDINVRPPWDGPLSCTQAKRRRKKSVHFFDDDERPMVDTNAIADGDRQVSEIEACAELAEATDSESDDPSPPSSPVDGRRAEKKPHGVRIQEDDINIKLSFAVRALC